MQPKSGRSDPPGWQVVSVVPAVAVSPLSVTSLLKGIVL